MLVRDGKTTMIEDGDEDPHPSPTHPAACGHYTSAVQEASALPDHRGGGRADEQRERDGQPQRCDRSAGVLLLI